MNKRGELLPDFDSTWRYPRWFIKSYLFVQHCSLFIRRDLIADHQLWFDGTLRYRGDWDWIIRVWNASPRVKYINAPLSIIRMHEASMTRMASEQSTSRENQIIYARYGGNPTLGLWCRRLVKWRAMTILGWATLKSGGLRALRSRVRQSRTFGARRKR